MKNLATIATIALPAILASVNTGCVDEQEDAIAHVGYEPELAADPFGPAPSFRPSTCKDIADYVGAAAAKDGEYTLYIQNEPTYRWKAYCSDMQTKPMEYLSLLAGDGWNTSMYSNGTKQVLTTYDKVRIDPASLAIDLGDTTYASSTGSVVHENATLTMMPFGIAMSCNGAPATMNINLHGTSFRLESALEPFGVSAKETVEMSSDRQSLTTTVTGNCGWVAQRSVVNPTRSTSQFELRTAFFLPAR